MFKCKFAKMFDNTIFTKYGLTPVKEDCFRVQNMTFCVADGVTRDSIFGKAVPYPKNEKEAKEWIEVYPNPSGAYLAAEICARRFVEELEKEELVTKEKVQKVINQVNDEIATINKGRTIDYLAQDLYCCEAVGGKIVEDKLFCFSIGDCHITTFNKEFRPIFTTINNHKLFEEYLENIYKKQYEFDWENDECRIKVRKEFRNNPKKEFSFGALSGEKEAQNYIDTYEVELSEVQYICAYSDGYEPIFEKEEETKRVILDPESSAKEGKERTLILFEREQ